MPDPIDATSLDLASSSELGLLLAAHPDIAPLRFRDGELLVVEGEESQDLYIVLKGCLVVEKALPNGTNRPIAQLECRPDSPAIMGEMAYFGTQRRTATVRAVGACKALHLEPRHLDAIMAGFPGLTRILCRQFTSRLKEANDELRDLKAQSDLAAQRRLAQPGEVLLKAGEWATTLFQLTLGSLRMEGPEGSTVIRAEDLPGGFLEMEAFLREGIHEVTATAEDTCLLAVIDADHREAFLRAYPGLVLQILTAPSPQANTDLSPETRPRG